MQLQQAFEEETILLLEESHGESHFVETKQIIAGRNTSPGDNYWTP